MKKDKFSFLIDTRKFYNKGIKTLSKKSGTKVHGCKLEASFLISRGAKGVRIDSVVESLLASKQPFCKTTKTTFERIY